MTFLGLFNLPFVFCAAVIIFDILNYLTALLIHFTCNMRKQLK